MQRDGRNFTGEVLLDGDGLASHAGTGLQARMVERFRAHRMAAETRAAGRP